MRTCICCRSYFKVYEKRENIMTDPETVKAKWKSDSEIVLLKKRMVCVCACVYVCVCVWVGGCRRV